MKHPGCPITRGTFGSIMNGILASLVLAMSAVSSDAQTPLNLGFEPPSMPALGSGVSGSIANGWQDNTSWASGILVQYALDEVVKVQGSSSQRVTVGQGFVQFMQPVEFQDGLTEASVWMRSALPMWVSLYLRGTDYVVYAGTTVRLTPDWQQVTVRGRTKADVEGGLFVNSAGTGTMWLDDASWAFLGEAWPPATSMAPPKLAVTPEFFGMHPSHVLEAPFLPWPTITFGTVRSHDGAPKWAQIEPNPPVNGVRQFQWAALDDFVSRAGSNGQRLVYTIYQTPEWAATSSEPDPYGQPGGASPPATVELYAGFVAALAERYQGQIAAYEVWNEPDLSFWTGTPAQMVALEVACAQAVKAHDPAALVVSPPTSGGPLAHSSMSWLESYLQHGGGQACDVIACHTYSQRPEDDLAKLVTLRSLLGLYGLDGRPIWNDETGVGYDGTGTDDEVAAYVARAHILNWAMGVELLAWYNFNDVSLVGVRQSSQGEWTELTPAGRAHQVVRRWLVGATMTSCTSDQQGVWRVELSRNAYKYMVMWHPGTTATVTVTGVPPIARVQDLTGRSIFVQGLTALDVGPKPVMVSLTAE